MKKGTIKIKILSVTTALCISVSGAGAAVPEQQVAAKTKKVYIAPYMGKKYHRTMKCRGLNRAKKIKKVSLSSAKKQGRTKCKICY